MDKQVLQRKVMAGIENSQEEMFATLSKLVQIPSIVGEEGKAQEFMANLLRAVRQVGG